MNKILESINKEKPKAIVLTGDFYARSPFFWEDDLDTREGNLLSDLAISNNFEQLINEPTHIRDDGTQTCIDLLFTNQPQSFTNVEVLPHPVSQSKHLIIHGKLNFSMPSPPPYKRKIWEYNKANHVNINNQMNCVDWEGLFHNQSVDEMTQLFSVNFLSIMAVNIPNKIITSNDKKCTLDGK